MNDLIRHLTYTNPITSPLAQLTGPYQGLRIDYSKDLINYIRMFFDIHFHRPSVEKLSPRDVVNLLVNQLPLCGIKNKVRRMTLIGTQPNNKALEAARANGVMIINKYIKDAVNEFVEEYTEHMSLVQFSDETKIAEEESREISMAIDYFTNLLLELVEYEYYPEDRVIDVLKKEMDKPTENEEIIFYFDDVDDDVLAACQELMNHPGPKSLVCRLTKKYTIDFSSIPDKPEMFPPKHTTVA